MDNKAKMFFNKHRKSYQLIVTIISCVSFGVAFGLIDEFLYAFLDLLGIDAYDSVLYWDYSILWESLAGVIVGFALSFVISLVIKKIIIFLSDILGGKDEKKLKPGSYAYKLMTVSKIMWAILTVVGGAVGAIIALEMNDDYTVVGIVLGLLAGALIGLLVNLFMMSFAEIGMNTKRVADSKETNDMSVPDEIIKYKNLLDEGIITQEEFEAKKKQLLNI